MGALPLFYLQRYKGNYAVKNVQTGMLLRVKDASSKNSTPLVAYYPKNPDFVKNRFIYIANYYQEDSKIRLRITRYVFKNDTLTSPFNILKGAPANQNHTGCRLVFGPDKKLWITTGDADQSAMSQDLKAY